jgi:acyl-CoA thioesterase-2
MSSFGGDTAVRREGDALRATLSQDWAIWGPNGGYIASIALRAAATVAPADHRPAAFSCQYLSAAAFADVQITVDPVRQGRSAWCLNVVLTQNAKRFLQAQVWTTNRASGPVHADVKAPAVPPPSALKRFQDHMPDQAVHPFWAHFEGRPVNFLPLYTPDPEGAVSRTWQKLLDFDSAGDAFLDAARCLLLIDTMPWPTFHRSLTAPPGYIAPSLDLAVWLHEPANGAEWLLVDAYADTGTGGLIHGGGRIWTEDGRLIATGGSQLLVVDRG